MTRDELLALLARAAADPGVRLTEQEAAAILRDFDAGLLDTADLPLPLDQAIEGITREDLEKIAAALLLAALLRGGRERVSEQLRDRFVIEARQRAGAIANGDITLAQWQGEMRDMTRQHMAQQALLAAGGLAAALPLLPMLDQAAKEQTAFLSRFADSIAAGALTGAAWTAGAVASRATQYAGAGWSMFHQVGELVGAQEGYVFDYDCVDDPHSCQPCLDAEANGPYLAGKGPMPTKVCEGRGLCRCKRRRRYDMKAWLKLMGR